MINEMNHSNTKSIPAKNHYEFSRWGQIFVVPLLLILLVWVVHYWHSAQFGLYEDDLTIIPSAMQMNLPELMRFTVNYIINLYGHARPLSDSFIYLFSFLGTRLGGLRQIYWIGYLWVSLNVILFYFLLLRIDHTQGSAIVGGISYALFFGDTTQAFLTHSLGLQPSITLLLLALHAFISNLKWLAYPIAFFILFAYETPFPIFLAAPLLVHHWNRQTLRQTGSHIIWVVLMVILAAVIKAAVGEERVTEMSLSDAIFIPVSHMLISPFFGFGSYFLRPLEAIYNLNLEVLFTVFTGSLFFSLLLFRLHFGNRSGLPQIRNTLQSLRVLRPRSPRALGSWFQQKLENLPTMTKLFLLGMLMLILAYPLTFTTKAYHIRGRPTRLHAAAGIGSAMIISAGVTILLQEIHDTRRQRYARLLLGIWMGSLVGYGFVVQRDYVEAWNLQREFWSDLLPLIDDAGDGIVVLVEPSGIKDTWQIAANTWNLPRILEQLYIMPPDWQSNPMVFRLIPGWESLIEDGTRKLQLNEYTSVAPSSLYREVDIEDAIFIETWDGGKLQRIDSRETNGQIIEFKQRGPSVLYRLSKGYLYELMFPSEGK